MANNESHICTRTGSTIESLMQYKNIENIARVDRPPTHVVPAPSLPYLTFATRGSNSVPTPAGPAYSFVAR